MGCWPGAGLGRAGAESALRAREQGADVNASDLLVSIRLCARGKDVVPG